MDLLKQLFSAVSGNKVYVGLALAALTLVAHKLGYEVPGVTVDDTQLTTNLWELAMGAFARHAISKVEAAPVAAAAVTALVNNPAAVATIAASNVDTSKLTQAAKVAVEQINKAADNSVGGND